MLKCNNFLCREYHTIDDNHCFRFIGVDECDKRKAFDKIAQQRLSGTMKATFNAERDKVHKHLERKG
jgi:hypothetical protein